MIKTIVEEATGEVINIIEIEEGANWSPPEGCYLIDRSDGNIGDIWDGENFTSLPLPEPPITEPSYSTHISILEAVDPTKVRLAKVKRVWEGRDYYYDCLATQTVKDEYVSGKIKIGDYVIVHYDDSGEQIITAKIFKSW